jgi:glycosyltransferase involved in cell wall biosynthesis
MKPLKVLFITSGYPTKEEPSACVFIREHAKAVQIYNDVSVLHFVGPDKDLKRLWRMKVETDVSLTEGIPTYRVFYRQMPFLRFSYNFILPWSLLKAFWRFCAENFHPDIIHAHFHSIGVLAVFLGSLFRFPVIITEHFSGFPRGALSFRQVLNAHVAFRSADVVLPVSNALKEAIESYGIHANFRVVPNAVNTRLFFPMCNCSKKNDLKRLLFVGGLVSVKGLYYLIDALSELKQKRSDWYLDIVGNGPARVDYERLVGNLGLSDKITFHGYKPKEVVAEFMRQADIFVLPSLWENLPCVAVEAMASGLPILSTRTGGIPEIVDEERGILVPPKDTSALSEGLDYMMGHYTEYNPEDSARYARDRFSRETVGRILNDVYHKVLE